MERLSEHVLRYHMKKMVYKKMVRKMVIPYSLMITLFLENIYKCMDIYSPTYKLIRWTLIINSIIIKLIAYNLMIIIFLIHLLKIILKLNITKLDNLLKN